MAILASILVGWSIGESFGFDGLIDSTSIFLIVPFTLLLVFAVERSKASSWQQVCLACGVPLGLLWVCVGFHGMAMALVNNNISIVYLSSAIGFLTIFYGGIVSAIGYFAMNDSKDESNRLPLKIAFFLWLS